MRKYSIVDVLRYHKFASLEQNKDKRPIDLIKEYNIKFPELTAIQQMNNLVKILKAKGYKGITK